MPHFKKGQNIAGYTVFAFVKQGRYAQTYRVKDSFGNKYFLKLIDYLQLNPLQTDSEGNIIEIEISKRLSHPNVNSYHDDGTIIVEGRSFAYVVYDYVSGETLLQKMERDRDFTVYETKCIVLDVLRGLKYMHNLPVPVVHNEINVENVMLRLTDRLNSAVLIDFGYSRQLTNGIKPTMNADTNVFYLAPERFKGVCCIQTDLYAVGIMLYHMIFGELPYSFPVAKCNSLEEVADRLQELRKQPLPIPNKSVFEFDEQLAGIIAKATQPTIEDRFQSADEFIAALQGNLAVGNTTSVLGQSVATTTPIKKKGNGFQDVAGMEALKEELQTSVIDVIQDPEGAKQYGLDLPNGMLLYGPPGCGKTFIAEKFAVETGFNYIYVKSSDLASIYVHGSQEKIGKLFEEARNNAPTILCFDEFDALVPNRDRMNNASQAGEVNEFLSQLNNCGENRVFVIASTNKPDLIDPAVLRTGRIDKLIYIPVPDNEAREGMFKLYLKNRPIEEPIDYSSLADRTENFVASDIKALVDNAARKAWKEKSKITQPLMEEVIANSKPSVAKAVQVSFEQLRDKLENNLNNSRPNIGF